ncbi:hypothetical protein [uncultured Maribacter sp.]|uniref:hypothetical protein n=1 Tax=uncultured Maribacter sp. TaxID=431308 RepID=UPI0030DCDA20|tara:strand:+ start:2175 stop:2858 length:684 start_codon:yes stop_codon:yes gene_type:complete
MIKKYTFHELREIVDEVIRIPERLDEMTVVELKELHSHLEQRRFDLLKLAIEILNANPDYNYPNNCDSLDFWKAHTTQFGLSVSDLEYWGAIFLKKINKDSQPIKFNAEIFKNAPSEQFFKSLFDDWLVDKKTPLVAIHYVYRRMSNKNHEDIDSKDGKLSGFTIHCNQTKFAEYWNDTYRNKHPEKIGFSFKENGTTSIKTFSEIANASKDIFSTKMNGILIGFQY